MKRIIVVLVLLFSLCGCMESRELKERTIIEAVGIDKKDEQYSLIFQQYQPEAGQGKEGSSGSGKSKPVQSQGRSISEAIDRVTHYNGNEVFLGNSTYIVLGEEMARNGILQELHYFNGENEISPSTTLVIADGSAEELISAQAESQGNSSVLRDILEQGQKNGVIGKSTMMNVMKRLVEEGTSPYLPVISVEKKGEDSIFKISGMAVFDREKLVDVIPIDEAKGILWVNDEIERALLVVEQEELGILSAEVQNSKTRIKTEVIEGIPNFYINIECSAQLLEVISERKSGSLDQKQQKLAEHLLSEAIREETESAVRRCLLRDHCDVFRFCDHLKNAEPEYWSQIKEQWKEQMADCQVRVQVHCSLAKTGQQAME